MVAKQENSFSFCGGGNLSSWEALQTATCTVLFYNLWGFTLSALLQTNKFTDLFGILGFVAGVVSVVACNSGIFHAANPIPIEANLCLVINTALVILLLLRLASCLYSKLSSLLQKASTTGNKVCTNDLFVAIPTRKEIVDALPLLLGVPLLLAGLFYQLTSELRSRSIRPIDIDTNARAYIVNAILVAWGYRLAIYCFERAIKLNRKVKGRPPFSCDGEVWFDWKRSLYPVRLAVMWLIQGLWACGCITPIVLLNVATTSKGGGGELSLRWHGSLSLLSWLPIVTAVAALICEATADWQMNAYRSVKANDGHWCDVGLWKLIRHPNHLSEIVFWWSIYWACHPAYTSFVAALVAMLVSPILVTTLITKVSGVNVVESKNDVKYGHTHGYQEYKQHTPRLVPKPTTVASLWH